MTDACSLYANWAGVLVNGLLAALTFALLWATIKHNNRMWKNLTQKARLVLLRPGPEHQGCIFAPFGDLKAREAPPHPAFFFRLPIRADDADARDVEVLAEELWHNVGGGWEPRPGWIPAHFLWHREPEKVHVQPRIPRDVKVWCIFGFVAQPPQGRPVVLQLELTSTSFAGNHVLEAGRYRVRLAISGSNADRSRWDLEFRVADEWTGDLDGAARRLVVFEGPRPVEGSIPG